MSKQDIEIQLIKLRKNKTWLVGELQKNGFATIHQSELSGIMAGYRKGPKADAVLKTIPLILEREFKNQNIKNV